MRRVRIERVAQRADMLRRLDGGHDRSGRLRTSGGGSSEHQQSGGHGGGDTHEADDSLPAPAGRRREPDHFARMELATSDQTFSSPVIFLISAFDIPASSA